MWNPLAAITFLAEGIVEVWEENEELRRKESLARERERERKKQLKKEREYEIWKQVTKDSFKNPDEYKVLPYRWSPFGIFL